MAVLRAFAHVAASLVVLCVSACTPDGFDYDDSASTSTQPTSAPSDCDGEGCLPACPTGTTRNVAGACEVVCTNWTTAVDLFSPSGIAVVDERVVASGTSSAEDGRAMRGQLQLTDTCGGEAIDGLVLSAGDASTAAAVGASQSSLLTAGLVETAGVSEPSLLELDRQTYLEKSVSGLSGLPAGALPTALAPADGGSWVVGKSDTGPWIARVAPGQTACTAALPGAGEARGVSALADGAVVIVDRGGKLAMLRVDAASCAPANCVCAPALAIEAVAVAGSDALSPRSVAVAERTAYVVGQAQPVGGSAVAFAVALDVDSGGTTGAVTWDAGAGGESFESVSLAADRLFAGGTAMPNGVSRAALVAFALPLETASSPAWVTLLGQSSRVVDVTFDAAGAVFALSADESAGAFVHRCDADGC